MENEQDLVVFTDDDGKELTLEVLDYFFYNGQEYAVLTDVVEDGEEQADGHCSTCGVEGCEHDEEESLYIMKVVAVGDDQEEFVPVEDDLMETLIKIVQERFEEECDDEECECEEFECEECECEDGDDSCCCGGVEEVPEGAEKDV